MLCECGISSVSKLIVLHAAYNFYFKVNVKRTFADTAF